MPPHPGPPQPVISRAKGLRNGAPVFGGHSPTCSGISWAWQLFCVSRAASSLKVTRVRCSHGHVTLVLNVSTKNMERLGM